MSPELLFILLIMIAGFTAITVALYRSKSSDNLLSVVKLLQDSASSDRQTLMASLSKNTSDVNDRLDRATHVMAALQKNIGEMSEIGRGMKDIQEFLRSPKIRGNIGEHILAELLAQLLPKQAFSLQYSFKSGATVDAAITTQNGIIPIDAKFPMEAFRQYTQSTSEHAKASYKKQFQNDVRKHIRDISTKYILTDEGTLDYALMYIPTEAVYYDIANDPELFEYAGSHRVLPVSPTTFYAYMKAILVSLEGQKIEQQARTILRSLRAVQKEYSEVETALSILSKHLTNATNAANTVFSRFINLGAKIEATKHIEEPQSS